MVRPAFRARYALLGLILLASVTHTARKEPAPLAAEESEKKQALTIENWVPKKVEPAVPLIDPVPTPPAVPKPKPVQDKAELPGIKAVSATDVIKSSASVPGRVKLVYMNEMSGTIASIDEDARTLRLSVAGGFNPQFDYDPKTVSVESKGQPLTFKDVRRGDKVVIRYVGKNMTASVIEKVAP